MNITNFRLSNNRENIEVTITDAANISSLFLFTDKTYKDYSKAIDLSSKLSGLSEETFEISLIDLDVKYFEGIYYLEATDPSVKVSAMTYSLTRFEECILNKILELSTCDDCLKNNSLSLLNSQTTLNGIKVAVENGFIQEGINLVKSLNKYCSNSCKSCGEYKNIKDNSYLSYNDQ